MPKSVSYQYKNCRGTINLYSREEIIDAWHTDGQGHRQATSGNHSSYNVMVPCDKEEALYLSAMFIRMFAIPTCCSWDGATLTMYCGDAGSGAAGLMRSVEQLVKCFKAGHRWETEDGFPLFAETTR